MNLFDTTAQWEQRQTAIQEWDRVIHSLWLKFSRATVIALCLPLADIWLSHKTNGVVLETAIYITVVAGVIAAGFVAAIVVACDRRHDLQAYPSLYKAEDRKPWKVPS